LTPAFVPDVGALPEVVRPLAAAILSSLDDDKAEEVMTIDLAGRSSIADAMIVASGRSSRQVAAMAEHLRDRLAALVPGPIEIEGLPQADWVLIDAGDVIVHLFRPDVRAFYQLEKMWTEDPAAMRPSTATPPATGPDADPIADPDLIEE
jgi:ribosome-associated protein